MGSDLVNLPWRAGVGGRAIYAQIGGGKDDVLIGMLDTPELAAEACAAHNARLTTTPPSPRFW
jgi:hypothetical protein